MHKSSFEHLLTYLSLSISGPLECGVGSYKFILGAQGAPQKIFFGSSLDEQWACNGVRCMITHYTYLANNRDLKQPERWEKTSEVWVENVIQSSKNKCLSKLLSQLITEVGRLHWTTSFKEIQELLPLALRTTQLTRKNFSYYPKDLNQ